MADEHTVALAEFFADSAREPWGDELVGTALSLPEKYKNIALKGELYIEYLWSDSSIASQGGVPSKNHVVFQVPFLDGGFKVMDPVTKNDVLVHAARISMELTEEDDLKTIDKSRSYIDMGNENYYPGTVHIKLLKYKGKSLAANRISKFNHLDFDTLGAFVDFLTSKNLHQMSLLTCDNAWKGCRDFITQVFVQLRLANKVTNIDQDGQTLKENITKVHHIEENGRHDKLVDRGKFLGYQHVIPDDFKDAYEA